QAAISIGVPELGVEVNGTIEFGLRLLRLALECVHEATVERNPRVGRDERLCHLVALQCPGVLSQLMPANREAELGGGMVGLRLYDGLQRVDGGLVSAGGDQPGSVEKVIARRA